MIDLVVQVFRSPAIKDSTQLLLMLAIARRCGDENGRCFAKQTTLAKDCRLHPKTVQAHLAKLEEDGLIKRVRHLPDPVTSVRRNDDIYIVLPAVVLPKLNGPEGSLGLPDGESTTPGQGSGGLHKKRPDEETIEVLSAEAAARLWEKTGTKGRTRTRRTKITSAFKAALNRRPAGVDLASYARRIEFGVECYLSSADATKEGGQYAKGTHRVLEGDEWALHIPEGVEPPVASPVASEGPADDMGSMFSPGADRARLWMELDAEGRAWDPARGPRPGMPGCRVPAELQIEFGYTPYDDAKARQVAPSPAADIEDAV